MNELARLLRAAVQDALRQANTCMPGRIVSYDAATQTADIQPLLKMRQPDGREEAMPVLSGVPVVMPRGGGGAITWPLGSGDGVMLSFSQRSLDEWKSSGGEQTPDDPRMLDMSDAIATPGMVGASAGGGPDDCIELKLGSSSIRIYDDKVVIEASKIELNGDVDIDGDVKVDGNLDASGEIHDEVPM